MKAPASQSVAGVSGGRAGGASCSETGREGGMASDARIWDWIMQRKEPRSRSSLHPSVAASLAPLPFGQAAKKRPRYYHIQASALLGIKDLLWPDFPMCTYPNNGHRHSNTLNLFWNWGMDIFQQIPHHRLFQQKLALGYSSP